MFGRVQAHATHVMASHYLLQVHFCTFCGAHGSKRSYRLQAPCPHTPPKAGREAIRLISLGKKPNVYKTSFEERKGKQVFNPSGKKRPFKAFWNSKCRKSQRRVKDSNKEVDLLGPPSFTLKGPKAAPGPMTPQDQDFRFLQEQHGYQKDKFSVNQPEIILGGASHSGTAMGETSPAQEPMQFSAASAKQAMSVRHFLPTAAHAFSGSQARIGNTKEATPQQCLPPPSGNWPRRARRFQPYHAVCSQHGRGGSWSIANFCQECGDIAVPALD